VKVPKSIIGKEVRITWIDPISSDRIKMLDARKGRSALSTWRERGVIDDITEGVVRFLQSEATSPGEDRHDEAIIGWIPEELITLIEVGEFKEIE
jgi:hypothetical protein